jgi:hypothetical protein
MQNLPIHPGGLTVLAPFFVFMLLIAFPLSLPTVQNYAKIQLQTKNFHFSNLFENFFVHAVSKAPQAFKKIRIPSRIRVYIRKGVSPLFIRDPGRMF